MPAPLAIVTTLTTELLVRIVTDMASEANKTQVDVDAYVDAALASGMTEEAVRDLVFGGGSVTTRTFTDAFKRRIVSIIDGAINKGWGDGMVARQVESGPLDQLYTWRAESAKPCPDCSARNGDKRSMAEWAIAGLPRSGWSLCGSNCKCILDKAGAGNFNYKRKRGVG